MRKSAKDRAAARTRPAPAAELLLRGRTRAGRPGPLRAFLRAARAATGLRGAVTALLTGDAELRRLNQRFRGRDYATDVLSFPDQAGGGDLAISVAAARRQAREHGHSLAMELRVLILHGLLHLAGYDHEPDAERGGNFTEKGGGRTGGDAGVMRRREEALRRRFGLPSGLIARAAGAGRSPFRKPRPEKSAAPRRPPGRRGPKRRSGSALA